MLTWGEQSQRGFWIKDAPHTHRAPEDAGVHHLRLGYRVADLSAGLNVLAFVKTNGNSFIIRTNESKDGTRARGKQKFVQWKEKIRAVSCADDSVTLLSERGALLCVDTANTPRPLAALCNIPVQQVACGSQHSLALTAGGQVYTWGQDSRGQLGLGKRKAGARSPQHLRCVSEIPVVQVSAGGEQSFILSVSGGVFSWGRNDCGQLGLGDTTDRHTPTPVHSLNLKKTVHVSCGKDHTATLTKDGVVFTFGSGQHGQLGHNSFRNELRPRLVAELWGAKVIQVACGRYHTLVLTGSERIYSFGSCEQGQLGHGDESHPSVPLRVQLPQDGDNGPKIRRIFAGGHCSFATCTSSENAHEETDADTVSNGTQHCLDDVIDKWTSVCDFKSWKKIKQEIRSMFSSASCLNKSFLDQRRDKHFKTSPKYPGLNLSLARRAFRKIAKKDDVLAEVEDAVLDLLRSLTAKPVGVEGLRIHLLLNELLHAIQKNKQRHNSKLTEAVAAAVLNLSAENLQVIGNWWSSLSHRTMVKYVKVWKQALSVLLSSKPVLHNSGVRNLLLVLQYMYNANSRVTEAQRIPDSDFCLMIDAEFLREDLLLWRSQSKRRRVSVEPLILCSFPIVMDLQSKQMVFDMNADFSKDEAVQQSFCDLFWEFGFLSFPSPQDIFFKLDLRRASVFEDTFKQLAAVDHSDYKRRLLVYFDGHVTLDNLQVHIKDLFYEVFYEIMSEESRMFMFNDSKTLAWFPSNTILKQQMYFLFGVLCGLALYNQCIIYLPFPRVLFKKLLGVKPSLEDMMEFSPSVGRSLKDILEVYEDDDIENLYIDFSIDWDGRKVDLDPENPEKPVTGQNKKEFVEAYVNYAFNTSVESVFQEFKQGFFRVCDQDLVKLFRPVELQGVLVGKDFNDWARLKEKTGYEGDYHDGHPTIQMFWEVFDELSKEQKKTFLWFVTGFERVPILGMKNTMTIKVKTVQDDSYDRYYPETHTCSSLLELPMYSTKEIMQIKLTEALSKNTRIIK
ncbi:probable E3 ubiquitin-protein ligase HERC3 [Anabas testudineus]|uniref:probable E3 ubiquitin-protein ligase HERC3 n=1 Tax=Anabas testudineus TaxID=64144 RepID=UPI000E46248D|nr:probable E3 ubiquitin-protein ligase HERC3 [Anabas testudineus]